MKQSELLRKHADMMDMAEKYGIDDWRKLVQFRSSEFDYWNEKQEDKFFTDTCYRFALGVVEGKPVFEGDELYNDRGAKFKVEFGDAEFVNVFGSYPDGSSAAWDLESCSWTPPKPATVMVELLREDAEFYANGEPAYSERRMRMEKACRKALEN